MSNKFDAVPVENDTKIIFQIEAKLGEMMFYMRSGSGVELQPKVLFLPTKISQALVIKKLRGKLNRRLC